MILNAGQWAWGEGTYGPAAAGAHPAGTVPTIWGRTATGRALLVVLWPDRGTLDAQITGARELSAAEEQQLQAWEATR